MLDDKECAVTKPSNKSCCKSDTADDCSGESLQEEVGKILDILNKNGLVDVSHRMGQQSDK